MIDIFCVLCLKLHDDVFLCPDGFLRGSAKKIFLIDSFDASWIDSGSFFNRGGHNSSNFTCGK